MNHAGLFSLKDSKSKNVAQQKSVPLQAYKQQTQPFTKST